VRFLRLLKSALRMIQRFLRNFVTTQVIFLAVVRRGNPVGVRGPLVHFSSYYVHVAWHK
jgi:hypothetical protein